MRRNLIGIACLTTAVLLAQGGAAPPKKARQALASGVTAAKSGRTAEARKSYEKAVSLYPAYAEAWQKLGELQEGQKELPAAIASYRKAIQADPKRLDSYLSLARLEETVEDWKGLIDVTDRLFKLGPTTDPEPWLLNGDGHFKAGDLDAAEASAREAEKLDARRQFPKIRELMGWIYVQRGNAAEDADKLSLYATAAGQFRQYLDSAPPGQHTEEVRTDLAELEKILPEQLYEASKDAALPAAPPPATPAAPAPPTISVTTRLVEVNVIATDDKGPVGGLTKDDFVLSDNGEKQNVAVFEVYSRGAERPDAPGPAPAPNEFTNRAIGGSTDQTNAVLMVLDMLNTGVEDQTTAKNALLESLHAVRPGDHVGVYILNSQRTYLADYSDDSERLASVVKKYAATPDLFIKLPSPTAAQQRADMTRQAIWEIRSHLAHVPGRKSVVWISAQAPSGLYGADFAVYVVDARGLMGYPLMQAENNQPKIEHPDGSVEYLPVPAFFPNFDAMRSVAASTGGRVFVNTNGLQGAIDRAIVDADITYTLGFYPDTTAAQATQFHRLKLEVKRRGVDLRYRQNYLTNPPALPPERLIANAVQSVIDSTQISISARVEKEGGSLRVPLTVGLADVAVEGADRRKGALELVFVQRSADGAELDRATRDLAIDLDEARYDVLLKQGLQTEVTLDPKPGLAELKIVVLDRSSSQVGSLTARL